MSDAPLTQADDDQIEEPLVIPRLVNRDELEAVQARLVEVERERDAGRRAIAKLMRRDERTRGRLRAALDLNQLSGAGDE